MINKYLYLLSGLTRKIGRTNFCPSCGATNSEDIDKKFFHSLLRCKGCELLYRWPYETAQEMQSFYQSSYKQKGLTTDLPDMKTLNELIQKKFNGTSKDFSRVIELFDAISIKKNAKILDYGANWGYGVFQFNSVGFEALGYELSKPRASYADNLGVSVYSDWNDVVSRGPYDVVFSSHVLEHTPDPVAALRQQRSVLKPGGRIVGYVPNGSTEFKKANFDSFHKLWGFVHPVMIDEVFLRKTLDSLFVATGAHVDDDLNKLKIWDKRSHWCGTLTNSELLFIAVDEI